MRKIRQVLAVVAGLLAAPAGWAADWQLVWQDEFNGAIGPDWVFETGNGAGGWGNNEQQYYRRENATVEGGNLVITAKREDMGGFKYTSSRMKTQGKQTFKYGRIEARIKLPQGAGLWPAFWALGSNITQVGWPASGEIDIMEHVNTEPTVYGTVHWSAPDGSYASYGGNLATTPDQFHVYAVEWDPNFIRWTLDGVQFHVIDITGGVGGTTEFHNDFFLLLNMAVGGNWPGFTIDETKLPAKMYVDYVRVYQKPGNESGLLNAWELDGTARFLRHLDTAVTVDRRVHPYRDGNWLIVPGLAGQGVSLQSQNRPGHYLREKDGVAVLEADDGSSSFRSAATFFKRPGFTDEWANAFESLSRPGQFLRRKNGAMVVAKVGANAGASATFKSGPPLAGRFDLTVEGEHYAFASGVATEPCAEGGEDLTSIDVGDWMAYGVTLPSTGTYLVEYRVASTVDGTVIQLERGGGSPVYGQVDVPNTHGAQAWTTVSHLVTLDAGEQYLGLKPVQGSLSLNWIRITKR